MRAPISLYSEVQNASYAYPSVRLPREVYSVFPFSNYNGAELEHSFFQDNYDFTLNFIYGNNRKNIFINSSQKTFSNLHVDKIAGVVLNTNYNNFRFMSSYFKINMDTIKSTKVNPSYIANINLVKKMSFISTGFVYNISNYFVEAEYIYNEVKDSKEGFKGYYVGVGQTFDKFTPYFMYAKRERKSYEIKHTSYIGLSSLINASKNAFIFGLRYDFKEGAALKLQYDYVDYIELSKEVYKSTKQNVFSLTIDFVF